MSPREDQFVQASEMKDGERNPDDARKRARRIEEQERIDRGEQGQVNRGDWESPNSQGREPEQTNLGP